MDDFVTIPPIKLSGHVKIETFNDHTGKKVFETEGHNLFTNYGLYLFRSLSKLIIGEQFGCNFWLPENLLSTAINSSDTGILNYLILTDNTNAITVNDHVIPGNITGICRRYYGTSTDPKYGLLNMGESKFCENYFRGVFDFATDRANGTHKSVFFANATDNTSQGYMNLLAMKKAILPTYKPVRTYGRFSEDENGNLYGAYGTTLYKISPIDYSEIGTYTLAVQPYLLFEVIGNTCYYIGSANATTLYITDLSSGSTTQKTLPYGPNVYYNCIINNYIYINYYGTIYKINLTDLTYSSKSISSNIQGYNVSNPALCRGNSNLYALDSKAIYQYDFEANSLTKIESVNLSSCNPSNSAHHVFPLFNESAYCYYSGSSSTNFDFIYTLDSSFRCSNLITGKLLDAPVTKTSDQTMKVTYTISFSE